MARLQMFSWGFWGWGTATRKLVTAVDAAEKRHGFNPPIFVDIRVRRSGRAPGFRGDAFERVLGRERYRWMPSLGNANITMGKRGVKIACPMASDQLLDLALDNVQGGRRIIFFCACESPWRTDCHRHTVSRLLRSSARRRRSLVEISEWPGGRPGRVEVVRVSPLTLQAVARGAKAVPLPRPGLAIKFAGIPWGTVELPVAVGPAAYRSSGWVLPRFTENSKAVLEISTARRDAARLRRALGLDRDR